MICLELNWFFYDPWRMNCNFLNLCGQYTKIILSIHINFKKEIKISLNIFRYRHEFCFLLVSRDQQLLRVYRRYNETEHQNIFLHPICEGFRGEPGISTFSNFIPRITTIFPSMFFFQFYFPLVKMIKQKSSMINRTWFIFNL